MFTPFKIKTNLIKEFFMHNLILQQLHQRPVLYYPIYKKVTGSLQSAILLSQLMYWFSKKEKFYKTNDEIHKETNLSKHEVASAKKAIKKLTFIKVTREQIPAKTFYKIDWNEYRNSMDLVCSNIGQQVDGISVNCMTDLPSSNTKITSKITSKRLSKDNHSNSGELLNFDSSRITRKIVKIKKNIDTQKKTLSKSKHKHTDIDFKYYKWFVDSGATNHREGKTKNRTLDKIHALFSQRCNNPYNEGIVDHKYIDYKWTIDEVIDTFVFHLAHSNKKIKSLGSFIFFEGFNGHKSWSPLIHWHQQMGQGVTGKLDSKGKQLLKSLKQRKVERTDQLSAVELNKLANNILTIHQKHVFMNNKLSINGYAYGIISVASEHIKQKQNQVGFEWFWITKKTFTDELLAHVLKFNIMKKKINGINLNKKVVPV